MTYLPICQHLHTRPSRLVDGHRRSRCVDCGVEFAMVGDYQARLPNLPSHTPFEPTRRSFRY